MLIFRTSASQVVTDVILWETVWTCANNTGSVHIVQLVFFMVNALWSLYVIYRFWKMHTAGTCLRHK